MLFKNDNIPDWLKKANSNYMAQQSQDSAVTDFFARHNFTQQPNPEEAPGFFAGVESGVAGVLGGQLRWGEVNSPFGGQTLGEAADYFDDIVKDNARTKFADGAEFSLDYLTDPQGLRYDVGNTIGSGIALGAETAAAAAAVANSPLAAGAAAVGRVLPAAAKLWNSPLGKVVVGNVAQTPLEAISEGGNLVPELRQAGYSEDEIQEIANRAAALNIGGLGLSNLIQSYGATKVLGLLRSGVANNGIKEIAKRGALGLAGGGASNYFEEGMQSAIGDVAMKKPIDWDEAEASARTGGFTGAVLGLGGGLGGAYVQGRRAQQQEQAAGGNAAGFNTIDRVRALEGKIPYEAEDGTNCMRTLGIALEGTPYAGQINVDQAVATAKELGQLMNPDEYTPQPGDIAVVNDGNHVGMVTENGGIIQNGASHNGVYESNQSAEEMFGGVKYYIRTSDYYNGRAGVGRSDLRSYYSDEEEGGAEAPQVETAKAQGFKVSEAEATDNENATNYDDAAAAKAYAERAARDSALTDEALDAIAANRGEWSEREQTALQNTMPSRFAISGRGNTAGFRPRSWRNLRRGNASGNAGSDYINSVNQRAINSAIDRLMAEQQQAADNVRRELPDGARRRITNRIADNLAAENRRVEDGLKMEYGQFKGQSTPSFRALMQRVKMQREQVVKNDVLNNGRLEGLTQRAMNGDRSARHTFENLRPDVQRYLLDRHIVRLEAQNDTVQADAARKALWEAEKKQAAKDAAQREASKRELLQSAEEYFRGGDFENPLEGVRGEIKSTQQGVKDLLEPVISQLREGMGNGVALIPTDNDGRKRRMSNNAPWYSEWYKKHGRKPAETELQDIARDVYTGKNSYGLPGWEVTQENEADFARNEAALNELDDYLEAYEELEKKFAAEPNGGRKNGENTQREEHNNQNTEPQESQQSGQTREEGKNAEAEKEITAPSEQDSKETETAKNKNRAPAKKAPKKPKADARFTAKGEKLIPQTAELRGNEITVISKPAKNAANSERLIGVELPEGEYTITVDEWKEAGKFGNPNYRWHNLVREKYMDAFPNTVTASDGFRFMENPIHDRIIDNQITAIKQAVKAYDEKVSADTASAANDTQLSPQVSKRINGWAEQFGLDAGMLRSLIAAKPTESNINEFGRFSALKATADKQKVKAFFDNLHNDNLPMRRVSALFDSQLRQLIFALADRPTGTQQIKAAAVQPQAAQASRFDGNRAESALDKLIGRKQPKQQEQQTGKKFMNVFDESELEAEIAKAKAEMSKLSANPFFNPALMKSLFKIGGIYMQRGVNNFADWSARMVETLGNKVRPFLKSAWDALQAYPADVKFNDDIMTATLEFVGSRVDNGRSRDEIRNEFRTMYGDEYVAYVDAAYEGVNSYPTEIAENADVVNETETQTETEQPQAEAAQEPAANQSESAQRAENTADETTYGMNGALSIEFNPQSNVLSVKIDRDKLTPNSYSIIHDQITHLGFRWSDASKKWRARVNSNANEYDPVRNWARSQGFVFENVSADNQENLPQTQQNANVPQARFNLNEAQNGIEIKFLEKPSQEVLTGLKNAGFRWSGFKKHWYSKQNPRAMAFAESIGYVPENMVQSNQEVNEAPPAPATEPAVQQPAAQEQEATANGNDNDADGYRAVPENVPAAEVQGTESERTTERVREPEVEGRGVQVTGDNGRAAGERPVSGERRPAGESAAQSGTGSNSEGTSERGSVRALRPAQKKKAKASEVPGHNFTITADENIGKGGAKTKYKDNVAAIKLLKQLEAEDRLATPEEQKVLARYVGWGGLAPVFSYGRDSAWESEKAEIIELLTDEEYSAARGSTNNAHYTSPEVIKGVWDIIERLGFKGGKVLEPSMGIGNFFGMMPEKLRSKSSLNGVELDSLTGRIAKQLYQKASVEITGYEQTKYPDNYFDLAISNVPFGQFSLHDPKYNKFKFNIHNYFFAKAIDQVRPGGLVAFITSTGTMQSGSDAKRLRELLKNKADFIGAVRLPNTAFKENAGTEVTTDLIILQKREPGAAPGKNNHAWLETKDSELTGKYTQQPLQINEYYSEHPEMLIGKLSEDTLYGGGRLALDGTGLDVGKELESRVEKFPKNIYKPRSTNRNTNSLESAHKFLAPSGTRNGQFVITDNGVFVNDNGEMAELPKAAQARAKDYVGLREVTKKILDGQINPNVTDETLDGWRKDLNKVYDKFVAKYGYLNSPKNKRDLAQDPDFGIVSAIEKYTLDKKTKKESAAKADIFTKRTVNPIIKIDKADNPSDALALSLSNTGAVDIDYMADLTGQKPADVVKALKGFIYKDPATNTYVTAEEYLSGNVREKLEIAEFWGKTDPEAAANIEALKKVQPVDLTPEEISVNLGTPWIPESDLRDFAQEMLGMPNWEQPLDIRFNKPAGTWLVAWNKGWRADEAKRSTEATQKWGTARRNFANLLDDALNQRSPVVRDTDIDGKTTVNDAATQAAQEKLKEIKEEFAKWIWKDKDRAERLTAYYNRNFNNMRLREYNGSMLTLPGYSSVAPPLKQHQKDAVWRIIQDGTALLAHTVGAGKTWTMQTAAMELKRLGIVNKSMFVIPNHMLQQFENEFRIIYPNAKLLTISSENLPDVPPPAKKGDTAEAKKRRAAKIAERQKILSRIATEDWDGIIISHNMFKRIPMSPEAYNAFYQEQIDNMRTAILELTGENDRNSNRLVKELEKKAKSLEEKLKRDMNEENKDIVIPFEQLGVDEIFVDEADLFKNLFFVTKMNRIGGLSNTNSQRSLDMYMKTQYLAKHNNGRGIVFATGTPISNTMAEMFTMLRYLDGKGLKENDLDFFDNWAAQFTERETVFERSPDGQGYRRVEKFTKFKNMPELVKMFRKVADVKTKDDLNLKIPKLKNGKPTIVEIEPNEALTDYIKNTAKERAQAIHDRSVDPTEDNMLKLTGDLRKASLDMRLIDPTVPASVAGGKLRAVAENVYKKYKESDSTKGAQLVFCDLSTPKGTSDKVVETDGAIAPEAAEDGENVTAYEEIKKMLVKQGVPAEEVAFIHDAKTKEQKEELFAKVRDGRVRVLIGSTEKMGAGTNVQQKLVALHHVDAPWRPRDIEQREGRILRQGNENAEVEIFNYVTKDSFDANMWEKLKNKATMIAQALSNNLTGRTLEDADATVLSFAEIESLASGNPLIMEKVSTEADLNKYQSLYGTYLKNQAENEHRANTLPATIEYNKTIADNAKADIKNRSSIEGDKFSITLGKKVFNKRTDAKAALEAYASNKSSSAVRTIGKIGGFELRLRPIAAVNSAAAQDSGVQAELVGKNTYTCDATLGSIEHAVMHAPERTLERAQRNIETSEKELKAVQKEMAEPFKYREELEAAQKRLAEIDAELGITDAAGNTQYSATTEPAAQRSSEEVLRELQDALPNGKFEDAGNGEYTVTLPNNARIKVNIADRMVVNNREAARARGAHGLMRGGELNIEGSWQSFKGSDVDGLLNLSRTGRAGTAYHEVMHAAMDLALTEKEQQAMAKHFNKEAQATGKTVSEAISDGYVEWKRARAQRRGTLFGKLYNKMQDMLNTLKSLFTGVENAHNVMRRVESGEVWQRSRGTLYSGDSAPKFNVSSNKISQFVNVALKNADKNLRLLLGKVSNGEAKAIKDSTGYDVSGFTHVWLSEDVRHIQNRHGVKTEKVKGQIGLSEADMIEALEAIKSPNRIEKGSPTSNGEPSIRFIKQTGTGEYTVVEVVRQKNKRLAVKTMWKTASENTKEAATATLRADNSPQYTSKTDSGETASVRKNINQSSSFNQNISQQSPEVNGSDVQYSAQELTPEQKAAQAFTNTERKTTWQSVKEWVKKQRTEFYRDWIDKNDSLHGLDEAIEMTTGIKTDGDQSVYNRVQTLPATAAGMANALIEGDSNSLKALNERLKNKKLPHNVTMQMVLENINREKMDKAHPNYLKRGGFKNWIDAFGAYLGSIRLNEMLLLHDEAYQQRVKEWEANGSKGKKPEYKPYLLPKGLTQDDLESVIKNAPPEFRKAAQMYWQFNDSVLSVMEDAGLISGETHKLLNTKYKYYCPLMRDFSDTAAADNFINGLSNGGRGIGNVSSMLRRISIEGSERNVINPLESTVKAVAVMCNRAERNKVGQMAVELAQKGGLDAVIQEAEGTVADPKNCIFTVMFDGKKQAYKTTQELYGPIVGYNLPAAGFVLGVARNAARLLRAGATTSPSFIIRNLIRDTVFAGVSSKNGFMPIVDTIRGAYALAHDPRLRAEFKVAGVTQFNFYSSSEQIVKSLDEMAGGKAWKDRSAADIWRALMKYPAFASEFIESSTRMGEFMKARKKGASLEEAAQAARELTLDFSRSGVQGEKVNQIVPFFNAVLQGGDKMVRLIKQDPVGTGTKLAMYIVLPSLALWALNHDEDWYKEIDPEVKATCWLLPGGLRIPKPQEAGILFGSGIEAVLDQAFNKDPEAIGNWIKVFVGNMAPSIMPTIFLPLIEWQANYSFFRGQSITPQRLQNLPDELQYTPNTSAAARTLGGAMKLSPVKIDNFIRGYTGTMGMTLVQQLDWFADEKQNMPYKKVSEWPFLRDFTVNQNIQNRSVDDFYKMLNKANEQHAGYGKKGKPTPAVQGVRKAGQLISKAQKDIRELTVNPRLSPEAKRQRIDQRKAYIKNVAEKANMRFRRFFDD